MAARPLALADPKIPLQGKIEKNAIRGKTVFFSSFEEWSNRDWHLQSNAKQPTAATCSSSPLRPLAATCGHLRPLALAAPCGHLRPLAATCGHSSGCKWLQVAAFFKFKYRAFCNLNGTCYKSHLRRNRIAYIMHVLLHMWLCNVAALNTKRTCWLGGKEQLGDQLKLSTVQLLTTSLRNFGGLMSQFHCKTKTQHDKEFVENCGCSEMPPHHHLQGMF